MSKPDRAPDQFKKDLLREMLRVIDDMYLRGYRCGFDDRDDFESVPPEPTMEEHVEEQRLASMGGIEFRPGDQILWSSSSTGKTYPPDGWTIVGRTMTKVEPAVYDRTAAHVVREFLVIEKL